MGADSNDNTKKKAPTNDQADSTGQKLYFEPERKTATKTESVNDTKTRDNNGNNGNNDSATKPGGNNANGLELPGAGTQSEQQFRQFLDGVRTGIPAGADYGAALRRELQPEKFVSGMDSGYALGASGARDPVAFKGYSLPGADGKPAASLRFYDNGYVRAEMGNGDVLSFAPPPPKGDGTATLKPADGGPSRQVNRDEANVSLLDKSVSNNPYFTRMQVRADGRLDLTLKDGSFLTQYPTNDNRKWSMTPAGGKAGTVTAFVDNTFETSFAAPTADGFKSATFDDGGRVKSVQKADAAPATQPLPLETDGEFSVDPEVIDSEEKAPKREWTEADQTKLDAAMRDFLKRTQTDQGRAEALKTMKDLTGERGPDVPPDDPLQRRLDVLTATNLGINLSQTAQSRDPAVLIKQLGDPATAGNALQGLTRVALGQTGDVQDAKVAQQALTELARKDQEFADQGKRSPELKNKIVESLLAGLSEPGSNRTNALETLVQISGSGSPPPDKVREAVRNGLASDSPERRSDAMKAMKLYAGQWNDVDRKAIADHLSPQVVAELPGLPKEAMDGLRPALADGVRTGLVDGDRKQRTDAVKALDLTSGDALAALNGMLDKPESRQAAINGLAAIANGALDDGGKADAARKKLTELGNGNETDRKTVMEALVKSHPPVKDEFSSLELLGRLAAKGETPESARKALHDGLGSHSPLIQRSAMEGMLHLEKAGKWGASDFEAIRNNYSVETTHSVLRLLETLPAEKREAYRQEFLKGLEGKVKSDDQYTRENSITALATIGGKDGIEALKRQGLKVESDSSNFSSWVPPKTMYFIEDGKGGKVSVHHYDQVDPYTGIKPMNRLAWLSRPDGSSVDVNFKNQNEVLGKKYAGGGVLYDDVRMHATNEIAGFMEKTGTKDKTFSTLVWRDANYKVDQDRTFEASSDPARYRNPANRTPEIRAFMESEDRKSILGFRDHNQPSPERSGTAGDGKPARPVDVVAQRAIDQLKDLQSLAKGPPPNPAAEDMMVAIGGKKSDTSDRAQQVNAGSQAVDLLVKDLSAPDSATRSSAMKRLSAGLDPAVRTNLDAARVDRLVLPVTEKPSPAALLKTEMILEAEAANGNQPAADAARWANAARALSAFPGLVGDTEVSRQVSTQMVDALASQAPDNPYARQGLYGLLLADGDKDVQARFTELGKQSGNTREIKPPDTTKLGQKTAEDLQLHTARAVLTDVKTSGGKLSPAESLALVDAFTRAHNLGQKPVEGALNSAIEIGLNGPGRENLTAAIEQAVKTGKPGSEALADAYIKSRSPEQLAGSIDQLAVLAKAGNPAALAVIARSAALTSEPAASKARQALTNPEGLAATPAGKEAATEALLDAYKVSQTKSPQALETLVRLASGKDVSPQLNQSVRDQVSTSLLSSDKSERSGAIAALVSGAETWTKADLALVNANMAPDMVRALGRLPEATLAKHREALVGNARDVLATGKIPPNEKGRAASPSDRETAIETLVTLGGGANAAKLNEDYKGLDLKFEQDAKNPNRLTVTTKDNTTVSFQKTRDGKAWQTGSINRPDGSFRYDWYGDNGEFRGGSQGKGGKTGDTVFRDERGNIVEAKQNDGTWPGGNWVRTETKDGVTSVKDKYGFQLDSTDGRNWTDKTTGQKFQGRLNIGEDGSYSITGGNKELVRRLDGSQTVTDHISGLKVETRADGTSVTAKQGGEVTATVNARGERAEYVNDGEGKLKSYKDASGDWQKQEDGSWKNKTTGAVEPKGDRYVDGKGTLHIESEGGKQTTKQLDGSTFNYENNSKGQLRIKSSVDAAGNKIEYGYQGDELDPNAVNYGNGWWRAQNGEKNVWQKENSKDAPWSGLIKVNHENGQMREESLGVHRQVTTRHSNGSRVVTDGNGDVTALTNARNETYQFKYSAPHTLESVTKPDGSVATLTKRGFRGPNGEKIPAIDLDPVSLAVRENRADGRYNITLPNGTKQIEARETGLVQQETLSKTKTTIARNEKGELTATNIDRPDNSYEHYDASGARESRDASGNVARYDTNGLITDVSPVKGPKVHVERRSDGAIKSIGASNGIVYDASGVDGQTFTVRGSNPPKTIKGTPYVKPDGEFGFNLNDGASLRRVADATLATPSGGSETVRLGDDGSSQVKDTKTGLVKSSQDAHGFLRTVNERDGANPEKLNEVSFGGQVWKRDLKAPQGESRWTSSDGHTLEGDIRVDREGNFSMIDSKTKKETVFKNDGSTVIRDSEGDKRVHRVIDKTGGISDFFYSQDGKLASMKLPDGSVYNRMPDNPAGKQPQPERWAKDGSSEVNTEKRSVDADGNVRISRPDGPIREYVRQTDGWVKETGADGHHQFVKAAKDGSYVVKNELNQVVATVDALGVRREYGYDQYGALNRVKDGNTVHNRSQDGKSWTKEGSNEPPWQGSKAVSQDGHFIELQTAGGVNKEVIHKADGSTMYAENGRFTRIEPVKQDPLNIHSIGVDGQPNKISWGSDKDNYWSTDDGKNWKRYDKDGKFLGQEAQFALSVDRNGAISRSNFAGQPPTVVVTTSNGTVNTFAADGRKLNERRVDETVIDYRYDAANKPQGKVETRKDGTILESDARGRITRAKGFDDRRFEYNDKNEVTAFSVNGERYVHAPGQPPDMFNHVKADGSPVLGRDGKPETLAAMIAVKQDGTMQMYGRDGTVSSHLLNGNRISLEKGAMKVTDTNGFVTETVSATGLRTSYERKLSRNQEVLGRFDQLSRYVEGEGANQVAWSTTDGFNWKNEKTGETKQGFVRVDDATGTRTEVNRNGDYFFTRLDGQVRQVHIGLQQSLDKVIESKGSWSRQSTRDKVYQAQLFDKSAEQLYIMGHLHNPDNPLQLRDDLVKSVGGSDYFRGVRTEGYFARRDRPGDDDAVQLMVNRSEQQSSWFWRDRDLQSIERSDQRILGSASEERRRQINDSMLSMYGVSLERHFKDGAHNKHGNLQGDDFYRRSMELFSTTGRDKRSPEQQADLMSAALKSSRHQRLSNFMMAAGENIATDEGRAKFKSRGGAGEFNEAFKDYHSDPEGGGSYETIDAFEVRQATDYMDRGKLRPATAIEKATGILTNSDDVVRETLQSMSAEDQHSYMDGKRLSDSGRDRSSMNPKEQESLDFYNDMQKALKGLHWFGKERKTFGYEARIGRGDGSGTDLSSGLVDIGGHWFNDHQENLSRVENMSPETFERLMEGARWDQPKIKDARGRELPYHSEFHAQVARGMELNLGSGEYLQRAKGQLNEKIEKALAVNKAADTDPAKLKELVPAFRNMDAAKFNGLVEGYKLEQKETGRSLDAALKAGGRKEGDLTLSEKDALSAFRTSDMKPLTKAQEETLKAYREDKTFRQFMEGRSVARELENTVRSTPSETKVAREELFKKLGDPAKESLQAYRTQLFDSQKDVRRSLLDAIDHNTHSVSSNNRQAMWDAVVNMSPADRKNYRDSASYRSRVDAALDSHFGGKDSMHRKAVDHILGQIRQDSGNPPKMPEISLGDRMLSKAGIDGLNKHQGVRMIADYLKDDKDGSLRQKLASDPFFKEAAGKVFTEPGFYDKAITSLLDPKLGVMSPDVMKELNTRMERQSERGPSTPVLDEGGYFKDAILNAGPVGLKYYRDHPEAFEAVKKHMGAKAKELADHIVNPKAAEGNKDYQPKLAPEDKVRAFALRLGVSKDEVRAALTGLPEEERTRVAGEYSKAYNSDLRQDILDKVDETERPDYLRLTRTGEWSTSQTLIVLEQAMGEARTGILGTGTEYNNVLDTERINKLYAQSFSASMKGRQLTPEELEDGWKDVMTGVQSRHNDKRATAEVAIMVGVTVVALASAPWTAGLSLSALGTLGGVAVTTGAVMSALKPHLIGSTHRGGEEYGVDFLKYTAMTAAAAFDPAHLGGGAASATVARSFWGKAGHVALDYTRAWAAAGGGNAFGNFAAAKLEGRPYEAKDLYTDLAMGLVAIPAKLGIDGVTALARRGKVHVPAADGGTAPHGNAHGDGATPHGEGGHTQGDGTANGGKPDAEKARTESLETPTTNPPNKTSAGGDAPPTVGGEQPPAPQTTGTAPAETPQPTGSPPVEVAPAPSSAPPQNRGKDRPVEAPKPVETSRSIGNQQGKPPQPTEAAALHAAEAKSLIAGAETDGVMFRVSTDSLEGKYQAAHVSDQLKALAEGNPPVRALGVELPLSAQPHIQEFLEGKIDLAELKQNLGIASGDTPVTQVLDAVRRHNSLRPDAAISISAIGESGLNSFVKSENVAALQSQAAQRGGKYAILSTSSSSDATMLGVFLPSMKVSQVPPASELGHLKGRVDPQNELAARSASKDQQVARRELPPERTPESGQPRARVDGEPIHVKAEEVRPLGDPTAADQLRDGELTRLGQRMGVGQEHLETRVAKWKGPDGVERDVIIRMGQPPSETDALVARFHKEQAAYEVSKAMNGGKANYPASALKEVTIDGEKVTVMVQEHAGEMLSTFKRTEFPQSIKASTLLHGESLEEAALLRMALNDSDFTPNNHTVYLGADGNYKISAIDIGQGVNAGSRPWGDGFGLDPMFQKYAGEPISSAANRQKYENLQRILQGNDAAADALRGSLRRAGIDPAEVQRTVNEILADGFPPPGPRIRPTGDDGPGDGGGGAGGDRGGGRPGDAFVARPGTNPVPTDAQIGKLEDELRVRADASQTNNRYLGTDLAQVKVIKKMYATPGGSSEASIDAVTVKVGADLAARDPAVARQIIDHELQHTQSWLPIAVAKAIEDRMGPRTPGGRKMGPVKDMHFTPREKTVFDKYVDDLVKKPELRVKRDQILETGRKLQHDLLDGQRVAHNFETTPVTDTMARMDTYLKYRFSPDEMRAAVLGEKDPVQNALLDKVRTADPVTNPDEYRQALTGYLRHVEAKVGLPTGVNVDDLAKYLAQTNPSSHPRPLLPDLDGPEIMSSLTMARTASSADSPSVAPRGGDVVVPRNGDGPPVGGGDGAAGNAADTKTVLDAIEKSATTELRKKAISRSSAAAGSHYPDLADSSPDDVIASLRNATWQKVDNVPPGVLEPGDVAYVSHDMPRGELGMTNIDDLAGAKPQMYLTKSSSGGWYLSAVRPDGAPGQPSNVTHLIVSSDGRVKTFHPGELTAKPARADDLVDQLRAAHKAGPQDNRIPITFEEAVEYARRTGSSDVKLEAPNNVISEGRVWQARQDVTDTTRAILEVPATARQVDAVADGLKQANNHLVAGNISQAKTTLHNLAATHGHLLSPEVHDAIKALDGIKGDLAPIMKELQVIKDSAPAGSASRRAADTASLALETGDWAKFCEALDRMSKINDPKLNNMKGLLSGVQGLDQFQKAVPAIGKEMLLAQSLADTMKKPGEALMPQDVDFARRFMDAPQRDLVDAARQGLAQAEELRLKEVRHLSQTVKTAMDKDVDVYDWLTKQSYEAGLGQRGLTSETMADAMVREHELSVAEGRKPIFSDDQYKSLVAAREKIRENLRAPLPKLGDTQKVAGVFGKGSSTSEQFTLDAPQYFDRPNTPAAAKALETARVEQLKKVDDYLAAKKVPQEIRDAVQEQLAKLKTDKSGSKARAIQMVVSDDGQHVLLSQSQQSYTGQFKAYLTEFGISNGVVGKSAETHVLLRENGTVVLQVSGEGLVAKPTKPRELTWKSMREKGQELDYMRTLPEPSLQETAVNWGDGTRVKVAEIGKPPTTYKFAQIGERDDGSQLILARVTPYDGTPPYWRKTAQVEPQANTNIDSAVERMLQVVPESARDAMRKTVREAMSDPTTQRVSLSATRRNGEDVIELHRLSHDFESGDGGYAFLTDRQDFNLQGAPRTEKHTKMLASRNQSLDPPVDPRTVRFVLSDEDDIARLELELREAERTGETPRISREQIADMRKEVNELGFALFNPSRPIGIATAKEFSDLTDALFRRPALRTGVDQVVPPPATNGGVVPGNGKVSRVLPEGRSDATHPATDNAVARLESPIIKETDAAIKTLGTDELQDFMAANPQIAVEGLSPDNDYDFAGERFKVRGFVGGNLQLVRVA